MMRSLQRELTSGDQVGRYRLIAELARGGMGIVYLASTRGPAGFNKLLALKQLRPDLVEDASFLTMFLDEARLAARLSHPNIVQTNDVEQSDGSYFIAMEYLDGRSFSQISRRFAKSGGFPLQMSLFVLRDVLAALDYAHSFDIDGSPFGVVHRDISPQNIIVTFDGCAKVIDFGIAKARDSVIETKTGVLKGKVPYMAPEQLAQRAEPRSDVFSTGVILYEVVTGQRLWAGLNELEIMGRLARGEVPPVRATRADTPPALLEICRVALSAKVETRFASAAHMRAAIDEYLWSIRAKPEGRDLGALLSAEFGPEREASREAIERYLAAATSGEGGPLLPLQPQLNETSSARARMLSSARLRDESSRLAAPSPLAVAPWGRRVATFAAPALVVAGVLIGLGWRGSPTTPAPITAAATPHDLRPLGMAPSPISMIAFSVSVSPSSARMLIDGQPMPSNPFMGRFPKDDLMHRLRASAPGYVSKERVVSFIDNAMVDLSLDPRPALAPPPLARHPASSRRAVAAVAVVPEAAPARPIVAPVSTPPPPPPRSSALGDITPRHASDPAVRRPIDSSNPYGEDQ